MLSTDIRSTFTDFFSARGHRQVPSSSLVSADPTLMLTIAGMNQFMPYFLGDTVPEFRRVSSVQKCVRTSDIENVGRTARHATFFEMLGNFSFGDYFKTETIAWAWELLIDGYQLDPALLWITVYQDDDEAEQLWRNIGVRPERIQRLGMADNYWSTGVSGPCGPSSEIFYDLGPAFGSDGGPAANGERYLEIWDLVFMQNLRGPGDRKDDFPILGDLPAKNIDTGLGLDRLAGILQEVDTICETDLLAPTLRTVQDLAGREFPGRDGSRTSVSFQVVTEHARSVAFLIADGVLPSNEGRGYILRRLMRRAIHHARLLGVQEPVLRVVTGSVIETLAPAWPELSTQSAVIAQVVGAEEETFTRTLRHGSRLLDAAVVSARKANSTKLTGETAFELQDTYGFPIDLTIEAAEDAGLTVDRDRFAALLAGQRRRAQRHGHGKTAQALARQDAYRELVARHGRTEFVGYDTLTTETSVLALIEDDGAVDVASAGARVDVVLNRSPFYAESGGQVGDTGTLTTDSGAVLRITGTRPGIDGLHVHTATVLVGEAHSGEIAEAMVDGPRRAAVARSHSATHVLQAMLRTTLGPHAQQRGSLVDAGRLRFDFAHFAAIPAQTLQEIESRVNERLLDDPEIRIWSASRVEAEAAGATALFGEKYADTVRIVDIGDFSRELCGGTHVGHGSQAGPVRILGESSIGSSLRRIEALTGRDALQHYDHERHLLIELAALLDTRPDEAPARLRRVLDQLTTAQTELDRQHEVQREQQATDLAAQALPVGSGWLVGRRLHGWSASDLRPLASSVLTRMPGRPAVVVLALDTAGKAQLVAMISDDLAAAGVQARELLTDAAALIGGGAGGRGNLANAGGRNVDHLDQAQKLAEQAARTLLTG